MGHIRAIMIRLLTLARALAASRTQIEEGEERKKREQVDGVWTGSRQLYLV